MNASLASVDSRLRGALRLLTLGAVAGACLAGDSALAASVYSSHILTTNPVIYWNMEDPTGNFVPDLAPGGGATLGEKTFGAAFGGVGPRPNAGFTHMSAGNTALVLGGTNDTLVNTAANTLSSAGVGTSAYTVQTWFNSSVGFDTKTLSYVLGRGENHPNAAVYDSVFVGGNHNTTTAGKLYFYDGTTTAPEVGKTTLAPNTWHHLTMVRDATGVKVYLNGNLELTSTLPYQGGAGDKVVFGRRGDYFVTQVGALTLTGSVDEAAVWNRALSGNEVALNYQTAVSDYAVAVLKSDPMAYWRLNETAGNNIAADSSGNGHYQILGSGAGTNVATRSGSGADVGLRPGAVVGGRGGIVVGFEANNNAPTLGSGVSGNTSTDHYHLVVGGSFGGQAVAPSSTAYSVEMWMNSSAGSSIDYLFHRRDFDGSSNGAGGAGDIGDLVGLGNGASSTPLNRLYFFDGVNIISGATTIDDNAWYHVGFVRDGSEVSVYLNGELELTGLSFTRLSDAFDQGTWTFGGRSENSGLKFRGNLDEIAIYDSILTGADFTAHFNAAVVPEPSTWALLGLGTLALAIRRVRRNRNHGNE